MSFSLGDDKGSKKIGYGSTANNSIQKQPICLSLTKHRNNNFTSHYRSALDPFNGRSQKLRDTAALINNSYLTLSNAHPFVQVFNINISFNITTWEYCHFIRAQYVHPLIITKEHKTRDSIISTKNLRLQQ